MIASNYEFPVVRDNYGKYSAFLASSKRLTVDRLTLFRENEKLEFIGRCAVESDIVDGCAFEGARSPAAVLKFGLKIFVPEFGSPPVFRFCSRGLTHMNPESGSGLPARAVPTPHFHKVDADGILRAYQTPPLLDPVESDQIISDLQLGTNLFC